MITMNQTTTWMACMTGAILLVAATGCSRDFLDRDPYIGSSAGNFYQTPEDAEAATIACYAPLQVEISSPGSHFRWFFGDIVSDDSDKGGSGDTDAPDLLEFENFLGDPSSGIVLGEWQAAYKGITYCNIALENVPGIAMDEIQKAAYLGEAKFLRAYWYFNLVTTFGEVPLVTKTLAPSEYAQSKSPVADIWAQIEADLTDAAADLPFKSGYNLNQRGRATRGAANALLAKAYLYQKKWAECRSACEEVVGSNEYQLAADYGSIFTLGGENGPGSIWEIQYANDSGGNWGAQFWSEGTYTNVFTRARGPFQGYGFNLPTQDFVDEFETWEEEQGPGNIVTKVDPRLGYTVYQLGQVASDWGELTEEAIGVPYPYYARKYFSPSAEQAPFGDPNPNGASNDRVIRLAEVYLMHAEACNEMGDAGTALFSLQEVRDRAGVPELNANLSGVILRDAIWHERRVELGLEGHRFFDVVRQGRGAELFGEQGFVEGVHEVFPIPTAEITLSNGALTQNPGY
jgi:hypothetical protein